MHSPRSCRPRNFGFNNSRFPTMHAWLAVFIDRQRRLLSALPFASDGSKTPACHSTIRPAAATGQNGKQACVKLAAICIRRWYDKNNRVTEQRLTVHRVRASSGGRFRPGFILRALCWNGTASGIGFQADRLAQLMPCTSPASVRKHSLTGCVYTMCRGVIPFHPHTPRADPDYPAPRQQRLPDCARC